MSSVFLGHNSMDKTFVRKLARDLVLRGVRVWLDEAELLVGDSLFKKIASAIEEMEYLAVILSPNSVNSNWVQKELEIAMSDQLRNKKIKVLPVLAAECEIPKFLQDTFYIYMDTDINYATGLENLMRRLFPDIPFNPVPDPVAVADGGFDWIRNSTRRSQLLSPNPAIRKRAIQDMKSSALVVPIILVLLADDSTEVVKQAIDALEEQPASEALMFLCGEDQYIPFGDDVVDGNTIRYYDLNWLFARIYDYLEQNKLPHQVIQKLLATLDSSDQTIRALALFTLIMARVPSVLPRLISLAVIEEDDLIREITMWGLAEFSPLFHDIRIKNALFIGVDDLIGNVRYKALRGLRNYKGDDIIEKATEMLRDPSAKIVKCAIEILGEQDSEKSFSSLCAYLNNNLTGRDNYILKYAIPALASHYRSDIEHILIDLLKNTRVSQAFEQDDYRAQEIVALILRSLEKHGTPACLDFIRPFTTVSKTVEVHTGLQNSAYWPVEVGSIAKSIISKFERVRKRRTKNKSS